ncbi:hypothetical protein LUZ60_007947 [Juncus effusus]|nr:hypothetical protein LUZ60_007947 [Juncus effusus]
MEQGQSSKVLGVSKKTGQIAKKKRGKNAEWNDIEKKHFTEILLSFHRKGITKLDWEEIKKQMRAKFPKLNQPTHKFKQLQRDLKKKYSLIRDSMNQGLTFNREKCILEGTDDVWEKALQENPKLGKWQGKKFEDYCVDLDTMYRSDSQPPKMKTVDDSSSSDETNSPKHPGISTSTPSTFVDCNEKPQYKPCNEKPQYKPRPVPGIPECMDEYYKLDGFKTEDLNHATEIFKESDSREAFIAFNKDRRAKWLRQAIEEREKKQAVVQAKKFNGYRSRHYG